MDLNNQMVCMRKEIKKAKVRVIFKLVRRIRSLKSKKGNDLQLQKNGNRAEKLIEEIGFIKDSKSDAIFKFLLNTDLTFEDINKLSDANLQDRAFIRIGLIPFIKQKIDAIKQQVNNFDRTRSKKGETTSLKLINKITKTNPTVNKANKAKTDEGKKNETEHCVEIAATTLPEESSVDISYDDGDVADEISSEHDSESVSNEDELEINKDKFKIEQDGLDINEDGFEVVLPQFYAKSSTEVSSKKRFVLPSHGDISDIFTNLGQGYNDSEEEVSENERSSGSEEEEDGFFLTDSIDNNKSKPKKRKLQDKDDENLPSNKSTFVTTLSYKEPKMSMKERRNETFPKRKKKNRLGQRARKQMYGNDSTFNNKNTSKSQHNTTEGSKNVTNSAKPKENESFDKSNLHPSWEASRQRKQQSTIQEFSGKHIRFDD